MPKITIYTARIRCTLLLLTEPIVCENGYFEIPPGPGLGIELNDDELAKVIWEETP